jgi:hypothetical protein
MEGQGGQTVDTILGDMRAPLQSNLAGLGFAVLGNVTLRSLLDSIYQRQ